jgi:two-component system, LytTR family, response regulator
VTVRTLIVDDEPLARERVRQLLAGEDDVLVVGEAGGGEEALRAIAELDPHLVFLDIQMPGVDGLAVARALNGNVLPVLVFVTAYSEYACDAFNARALDYLLKPLERERFLQALERAREEICARELLLSRQPAAGELPPLLGRGGHERFAVRSGGRIVFLKVSDVRWFEAAGNYVRLHSGEVTHVVRATLTAVEGWLDPEQFVRIHRSLIVNLDWVEEVRPWFHGEFAVLLRDGEHLNLSRTYRPRVEAFLARGPG